MIGIHLIVDGTTTNQITQATVKQILTELPPKIDMHILDGPHIIQGVPENPGITGIEVIDKSHIAIHTFSESNTISIDIFSCKPYNTKKVLEYLKQNIEFKEITTRTITREILNNSIQ